MRVPLSWLKEFVDIDRSPEELAHLLTHAGMEVASVRYVGLDGAELPWDSEKILVANIREVKAHPNADRLVLAAVDYGGAELHTVVTGAPNLFPYRDRGPLSHPLKSAFAREGARLYDGHAEGWVPTTLKGRPVRGVMSDAMLCSEKELGISEEHEGIIIFDADAPVGLPLRDYIGDVVLELDLTPNYARCLSIVGVAREVAALTGVPLRLPDPQVMAAGQPIAERARVTIETPDLCPRFAVGLIEGVSVGPAPYWMQRRLRLAGMRPINNLVDISNYVMLEWGQPNHAFDADRVTEQHLIIRLARPGERLVTLDGRDRAMTPADGAANEEGLDRPALLVCDPQGALSVAGIMGGATSEVSDTTTRVLLEAAIWQPTQIRKTARALKLPSEASRRFERGVDYALPPLALRRGLELMRTIAGGTVAPGLVDVYPRPWQSLTLELTPVEVERIVGISLGAPEIAGLLNRLGFSCRVRGGASMGDFADLAASPVVEVQVPSFRQDVTLLADLCEEVARVYGYDNVPATMMADELPAADAHPDLVIEQQVRELLTGSGLTEVITHSLVDMALVAQVEPTAAQASDYLRISNPSTPEREFLRRSLLPSLLAALATNLRERERSLLFEIGRVYLPTEFVTRWQTGHAPASGNGAERPTTLTPDQVLPVEPRRLALAVAGPRTTLNWHMASDAPLDFFDLKGIIELLLARLRLTGEVSFVPLSDDPRFHPGRSAALLLSLPPANDAVSPQARPDRGGARAELLSTRIGVVGELHPQLRDRLTITAPRAVTAEIDLDALIAHARPASYRAISRYPATLQDLAVVAANDVPTAQVAAVIRRGAGNLLESLTLFDVYSGPQVGAGKRSLAYRLAFRAPDRTLSDEALVQVRNKIIKLLERELGASIRG